MKNKLIITESQLERLKIRMNEDSVHSIMVRRMKEELDKNYSVMEKFVREGGEYKRTPMIEILADNEVISPRDLYEYMLSKHKAGKEFTKQVIRDWMFGNINDNYQLSKIVPMG